MTFPLVLAFFLVFGDGIAQERIFNPKFEPFTLPGGNLANSVQSIVQDEVGFVWFGTQNGLYRFDGEDFKIFQHNPFDSTSIADNYVEWLHLDQCGFLWLAHFGGGVSRFDPVREEAFTYCEDKNDPNSLSSNQVSVITSDSLGNIWIGTTKGLNRLNPETGQIDRFLHDPADPTSLSNNNVRALYVDRRGMLWAGTGFPWESQVNGGLNRFDPSTESFIRYHHDPGNPEGLTNEVIRALYEDSHGRFWVGTHRGGLHLMDRERGTFQRFEPDTLHANALSGPYVEGVPLEKQDFRQISFIAEDQKGRLWIGALYGGINVFDTKENQLSHFQSDNSWSGSLTTNFVWNFFQTRDGVIWIVSGDGGNMVYRVQENQDLFEYQSLVSDFGLNVDGIQSIYRDEHETVWMGASKSYVGLIEVNLEKKEAKHYFPDSGATNRGAIGISAITKANDGMLWLGSESKIILFDPVEKTFTNLAYREKYLNDQIQIPVSTSRTPGNSQRSELQISYVQQIRQAPNGIMWFTSYGNGLYSFDPKSGELRQYINDPKNEHSIRGNLTSGLHISEDGSVWVGGGAVPKNKPHPMFMDRLDPVSGKFEHIYYDYTAAGIYHIEEDSKGRIWAAATKSGLYMYDARVKRSKIFRAETSSLPANAICSFGIDKEDVIWLTTPTHLIKFDPSTDSFLSFPDQIGLMLFFGEQGFSILKGKHQFMTSPEEFSPLSYKYSSRNASASGPEIRITNLFVRDERIQYKDNEILNAPIWDQPTVKLSYQQNIFSVEATCFDYRNPEGVQLEFQLENYDWDWRKDIQSGKVTYYNVPPGEYTLRVRGANGEGVWSSEPAWLRIVIAPPWWQTWWAYLLYFLVAGSAVYGIYRFQLVRRLDQAEAARLKELDRVKTRLFTNMTHEFRTPLTVISGMTDQVRKDPENWFHDGLDMISRNAQRLLGLVNQMLDLSKLESGKMEINLIQGDIIPYLKYLVENLSSYAESRGIQLHFYAAEESLLMDYDPEKIRQILTNLLSNGIKFTPAGGHVYIQVEPEVSLENQTEASLQIRVRDTGIGMSEEVQAHIFDRFFQGDDSATRREDGTGIGMALTHELVRLLEGTITVKSKPGKGTEFKVRLPISGKAPEVTKPIEMMAPTILPGPPAEVASISPSSSGTIAAKQPGGDNRPQLLVVEDNADVTAYIAAILQESYKVITAEDGAEGLAKAVECIPDLILSDVMMPNMDGFELCDRLKKDERTSHIPIVLLTAKADMPSRLEGFEQGADAYLAKPFHAEELLLRVRKLIESRANLQQYYLALVDSGEKTEAPIPNESQPLEGMEDRFVKRALELVEEELENPDFSVDDFCKALNLSHSQVHRKLSALTGLSANRFIRHIRLNRAKELLRNPEASVLSVAFDTGFSDPNYFGRVFRKEFGMSPSQWREEVG